VKLYRRTALTCSRNRSYDGGLCDNDRISDFNNDLIRVSFTFNGDEDRCAAAPDAGQHQNEQEPFIEKGECIKAHAVRISRRTQLICKNLMPDRASADRDEHQNRVDWASNSGLTV
jgi:hypothetical protein